jgi:hypothetical protein
MKKPFNIHLVYTKGNCEKCSTENHFRGPFTTKELAEKRIKFYANSQGKDAFCPIECKHCEKVDYEIVSLYITPGIRKRWLVGGHVFDFMPKPVTVKADGSIELKAERINYLGKLETVTRNEYWLEYFCSEDRLDDL